MFFTLRLNSPAMLLDDAVGNGQAHPGAFFLGGKEGVEYLVEEFLWNAFSCIAD